MKNKINKYKSSIFLVALFFASVCNASPTIIPKESTSNPFDTNSLLTLIAVVLLIPIYLLGKTLLFSAKLFANKEKEKRSNAIKVVLLIVGLSLLNQSFAQEVAVAAASKAEPLFTLKNILVGVILLEALVILFFGTYILAFLRGTQFNENIEVAKKPSFSITNALGKWWKKSNNFIPIEEEDKLDSGHSYDGIRELDNKIPVWFSASFVICILFAVMYLWRFHISESAPLQIAEYQNEMAQAAIEKEEYLKNAASNVDENTIVMLDIAAIEAGKTLFSANCASCHGNNAASMPGGVGPNLTDAFWLHGGGLKDIFKTIKYGYPEKGMISWKDRFSAVQMAQLASYVKSISNTNIKGKEPQGELFKEEPITNQKDTLSVKK
ncbi:MAG: cbb3-type cytochrome c oxidase N-terminal domain-containing protein [Chitinophagaceae bacterium]